MTTTKRLTGDWMKRWLEVNDEIDAHRRIWLCLGENWSDSAFNEWVRTTKAEARRLIRLALLSEHGVRTVQTDGHNLFLNAVRPDFDDPGVDPWGKTIEDAS